MKILVLVHDFFSKSRLAAIILSVMMTLFVAVSVLACGHMDYLEFGYDIINSDYIKTHDTYYCQLGNGRLKGSESEEYIDYIKSIDGISAVGYVRSDAANYRLKDGSYQKCSVRIYSPDMFKIFPDMKRSGFYIQEDDDCMVSAKIRGNIGGGDEIEVIPVGKSPYKSKIVGSFKYPYYIVDFHGFATSGVTADCLTGEYDTETVYLRSSGEDRKRMSQFSAPDSIIVFSLDSDLSEAEKDDVLFAVREKGVVISFSNIIKDTRENLKNTVKSTLIKPLFMLIISLIGFASVTVLIINKRAKAYAVYYMCGCSRKNCRRLTVLSVSIISLIPMLINIALIYTYPLIMNKMEFAEGFRTYGDILFGGTILDERCMLVIIGFFALTIVISVLTTGSMMQRRPPVAFLKNATK